MKLRPLHLLLIAAIVVGATAGSITAAGSFGKASRSQPPSAVGLYSAFTHGRPAAVDAQLADTMSASNADSAKLRVLASGLGRFNSRLLAFPSRGGSSVCYSLLGAQPTDPAASYCYQPTGPAMSKALAGEHFSPMALWASLGGRPGVQLFGLAFDDVRSLRVNVAGNWRNVPLSGNGFYLDLPGVAQSDVGAVEATLANGSTQSHDMRSAG